MPQLHPDERSDQLRRLDICASRDIVYQGLKVGMSAVVVELLLPESKIFDPCPW